LPGKTCENILIRYGQRQKQPGKFYETLRAGDVIRIETPGGRRGGYGAFEPEPGLPALNPLAEEG